jgi:hypothetical protein
VFQLLILPDTVCSLGCGDTMYIHRHVFTTILHSTQSTYIYIYLGIQFKDGWDGGRGGHNNLSFSPTCTPVQLSTIYCTRPVRLQTHFTVNWPGKMLRFSSLHVFLYGYNAPRRVNTGCLHSAQFMKGEH